jgi:hypothetical protein
MTFVRIRRYRFSASFSIRRSKTEPFCRRIASSLWSCIDCKHLILTRTENNDKTVCPAKSRILIFKLYFRNFGEHKVLPPFPFNTLFFVNRDYSMCVCDVSKNEPHFSTKAPLMSEFLTYFECHLLELEDPQPLVQSF